MKREIILFLIAVLLAGCAPRSDASELHPFAPHRARTVEQVVHAYNDMPPEIQAKYRERVAPRMGINAGVGSTDFAVKFTSGRLKLVDCEGPQSLAGLDDYGNVGEIERDCYSDEKKLWYQKDDDTLVEIGSAYCMNPEWAKLVVIDVVEKKVIRCSTSAVVVTQRGTQHGSILGVTVNGEDPLIGSTFGTSYSGYFTTGGECHEE